MRREHVRFDGKSAVEQPSLGSSAEERTVAELAALVALALLVVLALGFAAGGWVCAFLARCASSISGDERATYGRPSS